MVTKLSKRGQVWFKVRSQTKLWSKTLVLDFGLSQTWPCQVSCRSRVGPASQLKTGGTVWRTSTTSQWATCWPNTIHQRMSLRRLPTATKKCAERNSTYTDSLRKNRTTFERISNAICLADRVWSCVLNQNELAHPPFCLHTHHIHSNAAYQVTVNISFSRPVSEPQLQVFFSKFNKRFMCRKFKTQRAKKIARDVKQNNIFILWNRANF